MLLALIALVFLLSRIEITPSFLKGRVANGRKQLIGLAGKWFPREFSLTFGNKNINQGTVKYDKNDCPVMKIKRRHHGSKSSDISCIPHVSPPEACRIARDYYPQDDSLKDCADSAREVKICSIEERMRQGNLRYKYSCSIESCRALGKTHVAVILTNPKTRVNELFKRFKNDKDLSHRMEDIAKFSSGNGYNYVFLECTDGGSAIAEKMEDLSGGQLLIIPPYQLLEDEEETSQDDPKINVNVLWVDSLSRAHFYRTLPTVAETFSQINADKKSGAEVLDFELFQALDGHTGPNSHGLLTGKNFPKEWTKDQKENAEVGYGSMLKRFKNAGYKTSVSDDLCYDYIWGIRLDIGNPRSLEEFDRLLSENSIDDLGLTFTSCRLLQMFGLETPFQKPLNWCYNNRPVDAYHLQYAYSRHELAYRRNISYFSWNAIDVSHEHTGKRVQSLDWELSRYVQEMSRLQNTITLVLSDHGNTYTSYRSNIMEGQLEQFHPMMFVIVPDGVSDKLGDDVMKNMRMNQNRLVTMVDLHHAVKLLPIWETVKGEKLPNRGVFDLIPGKRSCDDLPLSMPNNCVCEGWDADGENTTANVGLMEFAVGQLNNQIAKAQAKMGSSSARKCKRLIPLEFKDVRERPDGVHMISSFQFVVAAGLGANTPTDSFNVDVRWIRTPDENNIHSELTNFDRTSSFGRYSKCKDPPVDKKLCVCDLRPHSPRKRKSKVSLKLTHLLNKQSMLKFPATVQIKNLQQCIMSVMRSYFEDEEKKEKWSVTFEITNICSKSRQVTFMADLENMKTSSDFPVTVTAVPYGITFVVNCMRSVSYWDSDVTNFSFDIR